MTLAVAVVTVAASIGVSGVSTAAAPPKLDKSTLKFGYIDVVDQPQVRDAIQAYFDDWNKRGGYKGHPIQLVYDIGGADPRAVTGVVLKQYNDGVLAFLYAGLCSFTKSAITPLKVLAFEGDDNCYDSSFMAPSATRAFTLPMLKWAIDNGAKRFAVLYGTYPGGSATLIDPLKRYLANNPSVNTTLMEVPIPFSQTAADLDGAIARMKASGVDAVVQIGVPENAVLALQEANRNGFGPQDGIKWIFPPTLYLPSAAAPLEGAYVDSLTYPWEATDNKAVKKMKRVTKNVSPKDGNAAAAYQIAAILEQGLKNLKGKPTRENVLKLFLGFDQFKMPLSPVTVDMTNLANNPSASTILQVENGAFVPAGEFVVIPSEEFS